MTKLIVLSEEELRKVVSEAVAEAMPSQEVRVYSDKLYVEDALAFLCDSGYPISKSKLYKLSSKNEIPSEMFGRKLRFAKSELTKWAESQVNNSK